MIVASTTAVLYLVFLPLRALADVSQRAFAFRLEQARRPWQMWADNHLGAPAQILRR